MVNFDHRWFDILSSRYGANRTMRVINSVVYNFRDFFVSAFLNFDIFAEELAENLRTSKNQTFAATSGLDKGFVKSSELMYN